MEPFIHLVGLIKKAPGQRKRRGYILETKHFKNRDVYITWHLAVGATAAVPSWALSIRKGQSPKEVKVWDEKDSVRKTILFVVF